MSFESKMRNLARLGLLHGLGFDQRPRPLFIDSYQTEDHGHLIPMLAEEAYKLGVETVDVRYRYPELERAMFLHAPESHKIYEPTWVSVRAQDIVDRDGARIALSGNGGLGVFDDIDPRYPSEFHSAYFKANEPYTTRRMKMLQPWSVLNVPTVAWAKKLNMSIEELWEFLFTITGADREDPMGYANEVDMEIHRHCDLLNVSGIRALHFVGKGTDLRIGLSPQSRWLGGRKQSEDGTWFEANWPSFEIYTTPDWRKTEGFVSLTMPAMIQGQIVSNLRVWFRGGRVSNFEAESGGDVFEAMISQDAGAVRLGEIALVDLSSPLSKYTKPHYSVMIDENKRCHMAFGNAYPAALKGGSTASREELDELGCNSSEIHQDVMISDDTTSVFGLDAEYNRIAHLMERGRWVGDFA